LKFGKRRKRADAKSKLTPELIAHLCAHISNGALFNQRANAREFPTKSAALKAAEEKARADREQLEKQLQREQTKRRPIGFEHA
jgi:hypothetical protein